MALSAWYIFLKNHILKSQLPLIYIYLMCVNYIVYNLISPTKYYTGTIQHSSPQSKSTWFDTHNLANYLVTRLPLKAFSMKRSTDKSKECSPFGPLTQKFNRSLKNTSKKPPKFTLLQLMALMPISYSDITDSDAEPKKKPSLNSETFQSTWPTKPKNSSNSKPPSKPI
jgi:hypothetical protein